MDSRIEYLEQEFNYYYYEVRKISNHLTDINNGFDITDSEEQRAINFWIHEYLQRMYNILCVYFESLNLHSYLGEFKQKFGAIIIDEKKSTDTSAIPINYGDIEVDLTLFVEWKKFLTPFHFFWDKNDNKEEVEKIIQLIKSTNDILKITKTIVSKEEDINSVMRDILNLYYADVTAYSQGYFRHSFKEYRPDVIIGEIGVAIEYKLIRLNKEIGNKLDELIVDANRYIGSHKNKKCIAVFCLSKKVSKTKKQIKEDWNKMEFPENWSLIIIPDIEMI